jgi:hypothetical protein
MIYIWQQTLLEHPISDSLPANNNVIDHLRTSDMDLFANDDKINHVHRVKR